MIRRRAGAWVLVAALALLSSSCAYYNTFYLAKRYYATATGGQPYAVDKPAGAQGSQTGNYQKSIDYSKKLIAGYPKSKWVDDAYLLWAQALLGKEDPLQTVTMLQDFSTRYPESPRKEDAIFYLGVAHRQARKHHEALVALDEYLEKSPNGELAPYAHFERSRALMSLNRPAESAQAASQVIERYPDHALVVRVRAARAEALLAGGDPAGARKDFQFLGSRAVDDAERFTFLLREADCLEAARDYEGGLSLLSAALAQEPAPIKSASGAAPTGLGADRYGQLTLRIGTIHVLAGRSEQALAAYRNVIQDYPKTGLAAEAQYRIGYVHETVLDDFEAARLEYAKVRDQTVSSAFYTQANQRLQSLERLSQFRGAGSDSSERKVEAGFLLAEQYLFQLDKPDRAVEAYAELAREHVGTPAAAKAMNAWAWVLRHKFDRPATADSLLWRVVREYPATESQLAARDYLEAGGHTVPAELIKMPERRITAADTASAPPPPSPAPNQIGPPRTPLGQLRPGVSDSLIPDAREPQVGQPFPSNRNPLMFPPAAQDSLRKTPPTLPGRTGTGLKDSLGVRRDSLRSTPPDSSRFPAVIRPTPAVADSIRRAVTDTTRRVPGDLVRRSVVDSVRAQAPPGSVVGPRRAPADTTRRAPPDTTRRAPPDTTRRAPPDTTRRAPPRRWIPTDTLRWVPR